MSSYALSLALTRQFLCESSDMSYVDLQQVFEVKPLWNVVFRPCFARFHPPNDMRSLEYSCRGVV